MIIGTLNDLKKFNKRVMNDIIYITIFGLRKIATNTTVDNVYFTLTIDTTMWTKTPTVLSTHYHLLKTYNSKSNICSNTILAAPMLVECSPKVDGNILTLRLGYKRYFSTFLFNISK